MAQGALSPGTTVPRKRAFFGLLDSDGWGWASVKAGIWLVFIILILGYLPDRAYYLTVAETVDLGVLVWSPDQPLPAREPDAAVPGAGRGGRAVGELAGGAGPAGGADRRHRDPDRQPPAVHRRDRRYGRPVDGLRRDRP